MSHIETVKVTITDLDAFKAACKAEGAEFATNQKTFRWYGMAVGSGQRTMPPGFTAEDFGKCEHAVKLPGVNYEIGVVKLRDKGPTRYTLMYDNWGNAGWGGHDGEKLEEKFGRGLTKLTDAYSLHALQRKARAKGYMTTTKKVGGKVHLVCVVP